MRTSFDCKRAFLCFGFLLLGLFVQTTWAADQTAGSSKKQIALVIGNSSYAGSPLRNPVNDAHDVAEKLKGFGFDVVYRENLKIAQVGKMLRDFKQKLAPGATTVVFYAGHGLQVRGENFFPVTDADITTEEDVPIQSLALHQILDILDDAHTSTNIVILDACRDNPFATRTRSLSRGLAKVNSPSGTLIAYSTRPGSVAEDGTSKNGVYTEQLLKVIDSHKPIEQVLKQLVTSVKLSSKGRQEPWSEGSLEGDFCFGGCVDLDAEKLQAELNLWESVLLTSKAEDFKNYLQSYPNGKFTSVAKKMLEKIEAQNAQSQKVPAQSDQKAEYEALLQQAQLIKQQELSRLEFEKLGKEKAIRDLEEKLQMESMNRNKLEEELKRAKDQAQAMQVNASATEQRDRSEKEKALAEAEEKLRQEALIRSKLEEDLQKAKLEAQASRTKQNSQTSDEGTQKKLFISPVF